MSQIFDLWIVCYPSANSEMLDVLFDASPRSLVTMGRGGMDPSEIAAAYNSYPEALALAKRLLDERDAKAEIEAALEAAR